MKLYTLSLHIHEIMSIVMISIALLTGLYYLGVQHGQKQKQQ